MASYQTYIVSSSKLDHATKQKNSFYLSSEFVVSFVFQTSASR